MQDAFFTALSVPTQNRYPNCLNLLSLCAPSESGSMGLFLTAEFGEQWQPLAAGRVKFGVKGGRFCLSLPQQTELLEECDREAFLDATDLLALSVMKEAAGENERCWRLRAKQKDLFHGAIANLKLGAFSSAPPLEALKMVFSVEAADVTIAAAEDLWKHDISPERHALLDRAIARFLAQHCLSPYLSAANPESEVKDTDAEQAEQELQQTIAAFGTTQTEDFLELAAIAHLEPRSDLAGGNLMATDLSGLDFSGANLERVNLRGANLNDTDFSNANLTAAKLAGADLSGAYLGNANLCDANLRRASLALANSSGANASGANFQEANLSNTNLAGVNVEGAIFGQNPGLTEEMKSNLLERGAIFAED